MSGTNASKPQWEYHLVGVRDNDDASAKELLNHYGYEGWELVSVVPRTINDGNRLTAIFKRITRITQDEYYKSLGYDPRLMRKPE